MTVFVKVTKNQVAAGKEIL